MCTPHAHCQMSMLLLCMVVHLYEHTHTHTHIHTSTHLYGNSALTSHIAQSVHNWLRCAHCKCIVLSKMTTDNSKNASCTLPHYLTQVEWHQISCNKDWCVCHLWPDIKGCQNANQSRYDSVYWQSNTQLVTMLWLAVRQNYYQASTLCLTYQI